MEREEFSPLFLSPVDTGWTIFIFSIKFDLIDGSTRFSSTPRSNVFGWVNSITRSFFTATDLSRWFRSSSKQSRSVLMVLRSVDTGTVITGVTNLTPSVWPSFIFFIHRWEKSFFHPRPCRRWQRNWILYRWQRMGVTRIFEWQNSPKPDQRIWPTKKERANKKSLWSPTMSKYWRHQNVTDRSSVRARSRIDLLGDLYGYHCTFELEVRSRWRTRSLPLPSESSRSNCERFVERSCPKLVSSMCHSVALRCIHFKISEQFVDLRWWTNRCRSSL